MDRRTSLASASLALAAGVSGLSAVRADSPRTTARRELIIAQAGEPHSVDPHASTLR